MDFVDDSLVQCLHFAQVVSSDSEFNVIRYSSKVLFLMFKEEDSSAHRGCIYLIKNAVISWNIITI